MDFLEALGISIDARNLFAQGYDATEVFRALGPATPHRTTAIITRARARGLYLYDLQAQTGNGIWPAIINVPYPLPPSIIPAPPPYVITAMLRVQLKPPVGANVWRRLEVPMASAVTGNVAEATCEFAAQDLADDYEWELVSWVTQFWR